jgi:hypothetical protein
MFGFMTPAAETLNYRSIYSRCCQHQRAHYGLLSLPFHSYEAVFLYTCALDDGLFPESVILPQRCCKLRRGKGILSSSDTEIGKFCASLAVLLTDIKLQDDIRDHSSLVARLYRRLLRGPIARAADYFHSLDPEFGRSVHDFVQEHLAQEDSASSTDLRQYVRPTAEAFAFVFGLVSRLRCSPAHPDVYASIGRHLGAAIIAFDCATDWQDDRRDGCCNPVKDGESAREAARLCLEELAAIVDLCDASFGPDSRSGDLARSVHQSVSDTFGLPPAGPPGKPRKKEPESVFLYATCSVPVDHGSRGCCGCGRRAPTYVHLNQGESSCCCTCLCIGGLILCALAAAKGGGGGCK